MRKVRRIRYIGMIKACGVIIINDHSLFKARATKYTINKSILLLYRKLHLKRKDV